MTPGSAERRVAVNGAFRPQRLTGQQRYATEIANRLSSMPGTRELRPAPNVGALRAWAWSQTLAFRRRGGEYLLTLTSRSPLHHPRHVVVVHDLFVLTHPEWFSREYAATHMPVLKLHLRQAAGLVAVSEPVAEQIKSLVGEKRPLIVAPNAPADTFTKAIRSADVHAALKERDLTRRGYFLTVGSLEPRKNLPFLLRAYGQLPLSVRSQTPLVIVGAGSQVFRSLEISPFEGVRMLGYVDDATLAHLYAGALAVYFPTQDEGFGLPVVEALATGTNVVMSDIPVLRWVAQEHGRFLPLNESSVWEEDMQERVRLVEGGSEAERPTAITTRFNWDVSSQRIYDFIRAL